MISESPISELSLSDAPTGAVDGNVVMLSVQARYEVSLLAATYAPLTVQGEYGNILVAAAEY